MGANAFRLSFERSVIEPKSPCNGEISFNDKAVALYTNFCRQVKKAIPGIKILGTGTHFVIPQRVEDRGGFVSEKVRDDYVQFFLKLIETFNEIDYWLTFNEPSVKTLQTYRGEYPGNIRSLADVGRAQMNMVIAHCEICQEAERKFPDKKVGITHQWLKFQPFSSSNFLERLICHFYNKMFHDPLYQFFKTGKFSFPLPFCGDLQYEAPQDLKYLLGIQFYGFPTIKAGFNGGRKYPGNVINWTWGNFGFSFGATCREGEKASSFGPPINPEQLREVLDEAKQTGHELIVTENGCDAIAQGWDEESFNLDEEGQRAYFETVFNEILPDYREDLLGYCAWTLFRDHLEWDRGVGNTALGIITLPIVDGEKRMEYPIYSPAADFIRDVLEEKESFENKEKTPEVLSS